jgi:hypothetical protein
MKRLWPFGAEARRQPAPPPPSAPAEPFRSWALSDVLARRAADRRWRVLDLGSAYPTNLRFFAARGASYAIEELYSTVAPCRTGGRLNAACMRSLPDLLTFKPGTRFDAIFAWDLLDYLGHEGAAVVGERLPAYCHAQTLLYCAVSREPRIPPTPGRWEVVDERTMLHLRSEAAGAVAGPRFVDATLLRAFPGFRIHKSYLLKQQLQEYLLEPASVLPGAP